MQIVNNGQGRYHITNLINRHHKQSVGFQQASIQPAHLITSTITPSHHHTRMTMMKFEVTKIQ
jgi:hypothetical protein